jgi:hypothetical protein
METIALNMPSGSYAQRVQVHLVSMFAPLVSERFCFRLLDTSGPHCNMHFSLIPQSVMHGGLLFSEQDMYVMGP